MEVWENKKCCGNTSRRRVFPQLFRVLPNLHECFYNSIETWRKCFLFLLENSPRKVTKNEENLIVVFIIKMYILDTTQCTCHLDLNFLVFLSSYRNTIINQSAHVFSLSYFPIVNNIWQKGANDQKKLQVYTIAIIYNAWLTIFSLQYVYAILVPLMRTTPSVSN